MKNSPSEVQAPARSFLQGGRDPATALLHWRRCQLRLESSSRTPRSLLSMYNGQKKKQTTRAIVSTRVVKKMGSRFSLAGSCVLSAVELLTCGKHQRPSGQCCKVRAPSLLCAWAWPLQGLLCLVPSGTCIQGPTAQQHPGPRTSEEHPHGKCSLFPLLSIPVEQQVSQGHPRLLSISKQGQDQVLKRTPPHSPAGPSSYAVLHPNSSSAWFLSKPGCHS